MDPLPIIIITSIVVIPCFDIQFLLLDIKILKEEGNTEVLV